MARAAKGKVEEWILGFLSFRKFKDATAIVRHVSNRRREPGVKRRKPTPVDRASVSRTLNRLRRDPRSEKRIESAPPLRRGGPKRWRRFKKPKLKPLNYKAGGTEHNHYQLDLVTNPTLLPRERIIWALKYFAMHGSPSEPAD